MVNLSIFETVKGGLPGSCPPEVAAYGDAILQYAASEGKEAEGAVWHVTDEVVTAFFPDDTFIQKVRQ